MNIVICSDIHLDGASRLFGKDTRLENERREDAKKTIDKIIRKVQDTRAQVLFIAGDLFDQDRVRKETIAFLKESFMSIPGTDIFISPGNQDPAAFDSYYFTETWPENVLIFRNGLEAIEISVPDLNNAGETETLRVYGAGFKGHFTPKPFITENRIPTLDKSCINVLLMHASSDPASTCNYISPELMNRCGFTLCALGHEHEYSGIVRMSDTTYVYPGTCEPRDFCKNGGKSGGIVYGSLSLSGCNLKFEDVASRHFKTETLDITGFTTEDQIVSAIYDNFISKNDIYKITLTGMRGEGLKFSSKALAERLGDYYFNIKIVNKTTPFISDKVTGTASALVSAWKEEADARLGSLEDGEEDQAEVIRQAIEYGYQALTDPVAFTQWKEADTDEA